MKGQNVEPQRVYKQDPAREIAKRRKNSHKQKYSSSEEETLGSTLLSYLASSMLLISQSHFNNLYY